jgi:DNA-binding transcriptional MocR family regulator
MSALTPTLYEQLAGEITTLIQAGTLRPGERIPSVRHLSISRQVSIATVLEAYRVLEDRGFVEARPQSGYYVRPRPRVLREPEETRPPAAANFVGVTKLVNDFLRVGRDPKIVSLGGAVPSAELFPSGKLQRLLSSISRRRGRLLGHYSFAPANAEFQRELSRRSLDWSAGLAPEEFVATNGCMEALNLCLRAVTKPGDTVAVESPAYFGILLAIESLGLKALEIPTSPREGMSLQALALALNTRRIKACIVVATVSNPLGSVIPEAHRKRLVQMLEDAGVPLIEDEVYADLVFTEPRPAAAKRYDRAGNVMLCSSFSKTLAPGFRIGWVAPGRYRPQVELLKFINSVSTSELLQVTIAEFLRDGGYDHHLRRLRRAFRDNVVACTAAIEQSFPEGTSVTRPQGGFLLWIELPCGVDALELHAQALANGIAIAPGPMFSATGRYRNCLRLSYGHPWSNELQWAVLRLGELASRLAAASERRVEPAHTTQRVSVKPVG